MAENKKKIAGNSRETVLKRDINKFISICGYLMPASGMKQRGLGSWLGGFCAFLGIKEKSTAANCILVGLLALEIGHYAGYKEEEKVELSYNLAELDRKQYVRRSKNVSLFENKNVADFFSRNDHIHKNFVFGFFFVLIFNKIFS